MVLSLNVLSPSTDLLELDEIDMLVAACRPQICVYAAFDVITYLGLGKRGNI